MHSPYDFYTLQGYPTPFYKENFAYDTVIPDLGGGQKLDISRAKVSEPLAQAQKVHSSVQSMASKIPFVETLYMMGDVTYNTEKTDYIDLWLITSVGRYYIPYCLFSLYIRWKNIRRRRQNLIPLRLAISQSADSLSIPVQRLQRDTVWMGYTLLHLIPLYSKFQNTLYQLYEENLRIKEYFPQFTGYYQIASGCICLSGSSGFKKKLESICSGGFGYVINYMCSGIYKIRAYRYSKDISQHYFSSSYRHFPQNLSKLLIKRKTMSKGSI